MSREDKAAQFMTAAGKYPYQGKLDDSVYNNLAEEVGELLEAILEYVDDPCVETRANLCKEWADSQVVLSNVAWYFSIPASAAYQRVTTNNLSKVVDGKVIFREDGKILKPEGYQPVDMKGL